MSSAGGKKYEVVLSRRAATYLSRLDRPTKLTIVEHLRRLEVNPDDPGLNIRPLRGRPGELRLRVGSYRIIYTIDEAARRILVITIRPRGDAYKK
ncbi:MAG: type II toxin-antitoxin system RelE family toxin [Desulfotomaculales bacterium]